jgi:hypothetical protein
MQEFCDEMNAWLSPYFGGDKLYIDIDQMPAIAEKRTMLWDMADKSNDLTINERREMKGYEKIEGGDVVLVSSSMMPLGMASEPIDPVVDDDENIDDDETIEDAELVKRLLYGPRTHK